MKYSEMYLETCFETGEKPTKKGYEDFEAWRKRVEAFFEKEASNGLGNIHQRIMSDIFGVYPLQDISQSQGKL